MTGVPAMIGAKMILKGKWKKPGVWKMEQHDPAPLHGRHEPLRPPMAGTGTAGESARGDRGLSSQRNYFRHSRFQ